MARNYQSSSGDAQAAEGGYFDAEAFDDALQQSMDIKFTQLQDDLRFRRSVNISEAPMQHSFEGMKSWQDDLADHRQAPNIPRTGESSWVNMAAPEFSTRQQVETNHSSFPLYNYAFRRNVDTFPTTGSLPHIPDPSYNEFYYRTSNSAPIHSAEIARENEIRRGMEPSWNSNFRHRDPVYNDPRRNGNVFLKILATQLVSGTIIGRGGKGLNWFRRKSKVDDIMISMPWELYPRTEYRTLFLKGNTKAVVKATCIIADLMLSKYIAQHSTTSAYNDRMLVLVVLPLFLKGAMEKIKDVCNPEVISITLFHSTEEHQEIVAVIKGLKVQVKELVATIANSIAETVDFKDYCHVAYPGPEGIDVTLIPKEKLLKDQELLQMERQNQEERSTSVPVIHRAENYPAANVSNEQRQQEVREHVDTDVETEGINSNNSNDHTNTIEEMIGFDQSTACRPKDLSIAAAVAEGSTSVKNYNVKITITVPESKISDLLSISNNSSCYVTTASTENPENLSVSLSGPFSETTAIVALMLSSISTEHL